MVVPVPCRFALLLKFETRTCPGCKGPVPLWKPNGTKATPYGFRSPLCGTVEIILSWSGRKASASARGIPVKTAQSATPAERSLVTRFLIVGMVSWFLTSADILRFMVFPFPSSFKVDSESWPVPKRAKHPARENPPPDSGPFNLKCC